LLLQVPEGSSGVVVVRIDPLSDALGAIKEFDVIQEVSPAVCLFDGI
jgi:hypothetical protein